MVQYLKINKLINNNNNSNNNCINSNNNNCINSSNNNNNKSNNNNKVKKIVKKNNNLKRLQQKKNFKYPINLKIHQLKCLMMKRYFIIQLISISMIIIRIFFYIVDHKIRIFSQRIKIKLIVIIDYNFELTLKNI